MKSYDDLQNQKLDYLSLIGKTIVEKGSNYRMKISGISILPETNQLIFVEPNKDYFIAGAVNSVYIVIAPGLYNPQIKSRVDAFFEVFEVLD